MILLMLRPALVTLLVLSPALAEAQTAVGASLGGVWAAPVAADEGYGGRVGASLGVRAERPVRPGLALGLEGGVLQSGFTAQVSDTGDDPVDPAAATRTLRARVLVLTVSPTATVGAGAAFAFAGPRLDLRVAESASLDGRSGRLEEYDELMLGASVGAGVRLPLPTAALRLDVRTSWMRVTALRDELQTELRLGIVL